MNQFDTHQVFNQAAPFENINLFEADLPLREALIREGGSAHVPELAELGRRLGRAEILALARLANQHAPTLHNFDGAGKRIDEIEFHPAWHSLMALLIENGAHSSPWLGGPGAQVARAARYHAVRPSGERLAMSGDDDLCLRAGAEAGAEASPPNGCRRSSPTTTIRAPCRSSKSVAPSSAWA
jgi:hypothetical protein